MSNEQQRAVDLCERCHRDVNGVQHGAMCGYPLQPITDEEIAGIRGTYDRGGVAALGFSQVARLLDKIDSLREEARVLGLERAALRGTLDRCRSDREKLFVTTERQRAELEQARRTVATPILRQAWRNGWSDRARAVRDAVRVSDNERDAYERAFARYMSEDPAEADKDPYRPLDGPDDPAALPMRDAHCAAEVEKDPEGHDSAPRDATERGTAPEGSVS